MKKTKSKPRKLNLNRPYVEPEMPPIKSTDPEHCMTPLEVAERWSVHFRTLANWRCKRIGPAYIKFGHKILYKISDIIEYESKHRHT